MPVGLTVTVQGLDELEAGLSKVSAGRAITRGLDRCAGEVIDEARETRFRRGGGDPVAGIVTYRSGRLYRSIKVRTSRRGVRRGGEAYRDVIFGAGGRHGPLHEKGTRRLPKRPILAPALKQATPTFRPIFEAELAAEIRHAGLGAGT